MQQRESKENTQLFVFLQMNIVRFILAFLFKERLKTQVKKILLAHKNWSHE